MVRESKSEAQRKLTDTFGIRKQKQDPVKGKLQSQPKKPKTSEVEPIQVLTNDSRNQENRLDVEPKTVKEQLKGKEVTRPPLNIGNSEYIKAYEQIKSQRLTEPGKSHKQVWGLRTLTLTAWNIVHQSEYNVVEKILKNFDFVSAYGPVAGLTRLQRWNRAEKLGLRPPKMIKEILETKEGVEEARYRECYLYGYI